MKRLLALALFACDDPTHVYEGRLYRADRDCLATTSSVDVVNGDRPGDCGTQCLSQSLRDGGHAVYIASMCGPFPFGFDPSGSAPECPAALAALSRNDTCKVDGTSTNPRDAGSD
jgi:hypothetical protein